MGDGTNLATAMLQHILYLAQSRLTSCWQRDFGGSRLRNRHKSTSKRLPNTIVKVPCDPTAFLVLDIQYFCREASQVRFRTLTFLDLAVEFEVSVR